jgi:hypothetical protein
MSEYKRTTRGRLLSIYLSIYLSILLYIHPSTSTVTKSTNFRAGRNGVVELIAARPVCALDLSHLSHLSHLLRRVTNHITHNHVMTLFCRSRRVGWLGCLG